LKSIPAGGINITVEGKNFDIIQDPHIYVIFNDRTFLSVS